MSPSTEAASKVTRPGSAHSSLTAIHGQADTAVPSLALERFVSNGHGESAIPVDRKEEEIERHEDDWEDSDKNPRNWVLASPLHLMSFKH